MFSLVLAVVGAYLPSLDGQFIWDDRYLILNDPLIRSPLFCLEAFRHTLFADQSNFFRPVQTLLFIADYWLWGLDPYGYHLASILLHAANACGLFLLLRRILPVLLPRPLFRAGQENAPGLERVALAVAGVWALHPVHSAAVSYVSGSADSLAMFFCAAGWLLAECGRNARTAWGAVWFTGGSAVCFLFGLCSKEIAFVWLAVFAAYSLAVPDDGAGRRRGAARLCAVLLLAGGGYFLLRHAAAVPPSRNAAAAHPAVITALRALGDYGSLLIFPARLLMERQVYPEPGAAVTAEDSYFYASLTAGGVLLVAVLAAGCLWRAPARRLRVFGAGWFVAGFLPVSNLFVIINAAVAEHWLYFPSIGLLLFAAGCLLDVSSAALCRVVPVAVVLFAAGLGVRTYFRSFDWVDEITFYRQTVSAGGTLPRARLGMANAYAQGRDDETAIRLLRSITADHPGFVAARANLANALLRGGRVDEGRQLLESAFAQCEGQEPRTVLSIISSLDRLAPAGDWPEKRKAALAKLRERFPDSWEMLQFDSGEDRRTGDPAAGIGKLRRYADSRWWHYPSHLLLGRLLAEAGRTDDAVKTFVGTSRLDVHDAEALALAADAEAGRQNLAAAAVLQERAVSRQPDSRVQRLRLAAIRSALGRSP